MARRMVEELKNEFTDEAWRRRFVELFDLVELLGDCIIGDNYTVPDEMNAAIKLSSAGQATLQKLVKQKVNAKDARLMCALSLGHEDLFVDVMATDLDKFAAAVHAQLTERAMWFPFIYGRDLYDRYAAIFEGEKEYLTNGETNRLLDELPFGVYQYGYYTVGPYGLRRSATARYIPASRRVPAYHCAKPTCQRVHRVGLQTSHSAPINRDRDKLEIMLQELPDEPSEWWAFAADLRGHVDAYYGDQHAGVLLPLLGDALSDTELRKVIVHLLDHGNGELRRAAAPFLDIREAQSAAEGMGRAEMLQLSLLVPEKSLSTALDRLVRDGTISIPKGDVRRPVINGGMLGGAFRLRPELGQAGVRFVSDDTGLPLLRERRLLTKLYLREQESDVQELEWQLRGIDVEDVDERLEYFFRSTSPAEALQRLVLARRSNMVTACHALEIEEADSLSDEELMEAVLWKLGFESSHDGVDIHGEFWSRHQLLLALTQSSTIGSSERFLEVAAPYFTRLEGLLLDSLAFTSWALLVDHTRQGSPFAYDDANDRSAGLAELDLAFDSVNRVGSADFVGERVDLRNLMEAFRLLADRLEECRNAPQVYVRPESELPEFHDKTDLKRYLLRHTVPFLNLSLPSQDRIIDGLREIFRLLVGGDVNLVRNEYAHYRRTRPDISKVEKALESVDQCVKRIESLGFCRLLFLPVRVTTDRWGQRTHQFAGPRSYEHTFTRPTTLDWMGLPSLSKPQYLMRAASFDDPNEVLRFTRRYPSEFSEMWEGVPNRRRRGLDQGASQGEVPHGRDLDLSMR